MSGDDLFYEILEKAGGYNLEDEAPTPIEADEPTTVVETSDGEEEPETSRVQSTAPAITSINLFRNPDAHPLVLDLALLRKYGIEWLGWERETLELRIPQDFHTPTMSDLNMAKVQAVKTLHLVDSFWLQWEVFQICCMSMNGLFPDFEVVCAPTVAQAMVAVDIANHIREDVPWSDEIRRYLGIVHRFDGIFCPQEPLQFVKMDTEGLPIDCGEIDRLWPTVKATNKAPTAETVTAEQLRRMLVVKEYLDDYRAQLRTQLPVIRYA